MYKGAWNENIFLCSLPSGSEKALDTSPVSKASHHIERPVPTSQWKACLSSFVCVAVDLCTPLLALITSLVVLLMGPQCFHKHKTCRLLIYLDPALTILAGLVLTVTALPQVSLWEGQMDWFRFVSFFRLIWKIYSCCSYLPQLYPNLHWMFLLCHCSPGEEVWIAAATGHTSTHLCIWSHTEDCERFWGAECARPPCLAAIWFFYCGHCACALPYWLSSTQVKWKSLTSVWVVLTFYIMPNENTIHYVFLLWNVSGCRGKSLLACLLLCLKYILPSSSCSNTLFQRISS